MINIFSSRFDTNKMDGPKKVLDNFILGLDKLGIIYSKNEKIYDMGDFWQVDQNFLKQKIYGIIKDNVMVHDEFHNYNIDKKPFPSKREGKQFVGEAFDYMGKPDEQHRSMII